VANNDPSQRIAQAVARIERGIYAAVEEACIACASTAKQNILGNGAIDTGLLRASIDYSIRRTSQGIEGTVFASSRHAPWVEFGRRGLIVSPPGVNASPLAATAAWPNVGAIESWVRRKYRDFAPSGRTRSGRARKPTRDDVRSVAFLVSRKIANFGIAPRPFLVPAFRSTTPIFVTRVKELARTGGL
jgi:hypothetical protein